MKKSILLASFVFIYSLANAKSWSVCNNPAGVAKFNEISDALMSPFVNAGDTLWDETKKKFYFKNTLPKDSGYVFNNVLRLSSV